METRDETLRNLLDSFTANDTAVGEHSRILVGQARDWRTHTETDTHRKRKYPKARLASAKNCLSAHLFSLSGRPIPWNADCEVLKSYYLLGRSVNFTRQSWKGISAYCLYNSIGICIFNTCNPLIDRLLLAAANQTTSDAYAPVTSGQISVYDAVSGCFPI